MLSNMGASPSLGLVQSEFIFVFEVRVAGTAVLVRMFLRFVVLQLSLDVANSRNEQPLYERIRHRPGTDCCVLLPAGDADTLAALDQ
jgi:hypothetical protein